MPVTGQQQQFFSGVNAVAAADKISQDALASSENLDFSVERGAAAVRRGTRQLIRPLGTDTAQLLFLFRHYNAGLDTSPIYAGFDDSTVYRITGGLSTASIGAAQISTDGSASNGDPLVFTNYREFVYMNAGTGGLRDDGTSTTSWVKPAPGTAVTLSTETQTSFAISTTWSIQEGTGTFVSSTATGTADSTTFRTEFQATPVQSDLDSISGLTVGDLGIHFVDLSFDRPEKVIRVSIDYSIGDTTFSNYLHAELDMQEGASALPDADLLVDSALEKSSGTHADLDDKTKARSVFRQENRPIAQRFSLAADSFNTWSIPVPAFEMIGRDPSAGFTNIGKVRVVVECAAAVVVKLRDHELQGYQEYPLNDPWLGYAYWETFAALNSDNEVIAESDHSPVSSRQKVNNGRIVVSSPNTTPTGGHGLTHRIIYRQGGLLPDAYAVSTHSIGTATITDTLSDIDALLRGFIMTRNVRQRLPAGVRAVSEEHLGRIFIGWDNFIGWSKPGKPETFPEASTVEVSHKRDRVHRIHTVGDAVIIVNRDSVYEFRGSILEGQGQNWRLDRSESPVGSLSPRATIKTPRGILLIAEDGWYLYQPGQGVSIPISWAMEQIGQDIFKGSGDFDPAKIKGDRVIGMNHAGVVNAWAIWKDQKIWFGYPSASNTVPDKVAVLDFITQKAWVLAYPFNVSSCWADKDANAVIAGSEDGALMRLEQGLDDEDGFGTSSSISWTATTRQWSVENDTVFENLFLEYDGFGSATVSALFDGTTTTAIGTLTDTARDWFHPPMDGVFGNNLQFVINGTQSGTENTTLYQLKWDALAEPPRVEFWRTEHEIPNPAGEAIWDVHFTDIEVISTGSVFGTVFVDNTAVMTNTITGPTSGRIIDQQSYPHETLGEVGYAIYDTGTQTGIEFKLWRSYSAARPEPPVVTEFASDKVCYEGERHFLQADWCLRPIGTVTSTVFVDNAAIGTFTTTQTGSAGKVSKTFALTVDTYGRTFYVVHKGDGFKHYGTWEHSRPEPDRIRNFQFDPKTFASEQYPRTWIAELNPLGATVEGTLYVDGTALSTETFTGNRRRIFEIGLELDGSNNEQTGTRFEIDYSSSDRFKHYDTQLEVEPQPFGKKSWTITYRKIGGATRVDMARAFNIDAEPAPGVGTATITSVWEVDETPTQTNTLTWSGREWKDNIPCVPDMRGYIFRQKLYSSERFQVYQSGLDLHREGRKGVSMVTIAGTPNR